MESIESHSSARESHLAWWQIFLPDRGAGFLVYLLFGFLFIRPEILLWDGGSCRHFLNGIYMLQHHAIPDLNYTSAIFPNAPCLTRCWLGDLVSGTVFEWAKLNGLVFISSFAIVLGLTWCYQLGRARGFGLLSGLLALVLTMAAVCMHWAARCHVYSYLPFLAMYYLVFVRERDWKSVIASAAVMCWWVNLHGSFVIGVEMLAASIAAHFYECLRTNTEVRRSILKYDFAMVAACLAGTCVNPRGIGFYTHVASYLSNPLILHKTDEWRAFDITVGVSAWAAIVLWITVVWLSVFAKTYPPKGELLFMVLMLVSGIYTMRLIPYFALAAPAALGPAWHALRLKRARELSEQSGEKSSFPNWLAKILDMEERSEPQEKTSLKVGLLALSLCAVMGLAFVTLPFCQIKDFDPERIPVQAVNYMSEHGVKGLGFNYDNWGGYIYYRLNRPVFIDDWADFLPVSFVDSYLDILLAQRNWQKDFEHYNFQWVLVPNMAPIAQILSTKPQWKKIIEDKSSIFLVRTDSSNNK